MRRETVPEELSLPRPRHGAFGPVHLQPESPVQKTFQRCHDPLTRCLGANVHIHIVGITNEAVPTFPQLPIQFIQQQVRQQRRDDSPYAKGNFQIETRFRVSRPSVQECPCQTFQDRNRTLE